MGFGGLAGAAEVVPGAVSTAAVDVRTEFIKRTYTHLAGAIFAFVGLEYLLMTSELRWKLLEMMAGSDMSWMVVLLAFMAVGWIANKWATSGTSQTMQYLGLGLYVIAEVVIFCPLMVIISDIAGQPDLIPTAGVITLALFGGLTATVFITKKDFSFLRGALNIAFMAALGVIFAGMIFGFTLGLFFSFAMVALAGAAVLYDTSNVLHHYRPDQHVAASLSLFASIALMFWYVLRILLELSRD